MRLMSGRQFDVDDALDGVEVELVEGDDFVEAVEELRGELSAEALLDDGAGVFLVFLVEPAIAWSESDTTTELFQLTGAGVEVMMMTVLRKSMVVPLPSVSRPSSITCSRRLKTSVWAFSISSSRTME